MSDWIKIINSWALWYCVLNDIYSLLSAAPLSCRRKPNQTEHKQWLDLQIIWSFWTIPGNEVRSTRQERSCMCWEHMIRAGRAIIAQVDQAERHISVLTQANVSAKLLQLFVPQWQMYWKKKTCLLLRLWAVSSSKRRRNSTHLDWSHVVRATNNETSISNMSDVVTFYGTQGENAFIEKKILKVKTYSL